MEIDLSPQILWVGDFDILLSIDDDDLFVQQSFCLPYGEGL
jgi:hypothetical protein